MREQILRQLERRLRKRRQAYLNRIGGTFGPQDHGWAAETAENAQAALQVDIGLAVAEGKAEVIVQIDEALQRMANGTYGKCEVCGKNIPLARLRAVPFATMCVKCKSEDERFSGRMSGHVRTPMRRFPANTEEFFEDEEPSGSVEREHHIKGRRRAGDAGESQPH